MEEKNLIDKVKDICKQFGEGFSKGHYLVINNVKFKCFVGKENGSERVRVIKGQEKVFDYVKLKNYCGFYEVVGSNWEKVVDEYYFLMNRKF